MKLKKLLAGILSAAMVLGTMVMPAFADNTAPTFDIQNVDSDRIVEIITNEQYGNEYCGENGLYKKVYDELVRKKGNVSNSVYSLSYKKTDNGSCSKLDVELSSDKDATFLVIGAAGTALTTAWTLTLDESNNHTCRLGKYYSNFDASLQYFKVDCLIIPVTEELYTIAYDVMDSDKSYAEFKSSFGLSGVCTEDTNITVTACGYTDSNYTNKVVATNAPKTFNYVNTDVAKLSDGRTYASLKDAYAAAKDGDTITLLKDVDVKTSDMQIDKEITFNLAGHTISIKEIDTDAMFVKENVTFTSTSTARTAAEKGVIDITNADVQQGIWCFNTNEPKTITFDNIELKGTDVQSSSAVFDSYGSTGIHNVKFNNSKVNLTGTNSGRFTNYVNATLNNTTVSLDSFDGGFANGDITLSGDDTAVTVTNGNYAVNNSTLTMNDNSSLTAENCAEAGIKLGLGSSITLNGTASVNMSGNTDDIIFRNEVTTDEQKASVKINVASGAILDAKIDEDILENADVTGKANAVSVEFEATDNANVYNIVLTAPSVTKIHEFTSAQLKFAKGNEQIGYEIAEANDKISVNEQGDNVYLFNLKSGASIIGEENKIVIGKVIFDGYSEESVDFKIETTYENKVVATKGQNITETFTVDNEKLTVNDEEKGIIDAEFKEPECEVTINVTMNEPVTDNKAAYQNMKVVISGQGLAEPIEYKLGTDTMAQDNGVYTVNATLKQKNTYIITVSGEGYRTAKYPLRTKEKETATVNFWNNVQLAGSELVMETGDNTTKANANFIAGDIIKDNKLNIYDLSAVVAYFGDKATDDEKINGWNKVKYDINRDGKIDAEDVSIVLDAWKALEKLVQN